MASKALGTYSFLSYLRIGLANKITQPDLDPVQLRASFDVGLSIEGQPVSGSTLLTQPVTKPVQLYGPGDIVGIEPRAIFKTEPLNWITNFESNYLPYIDFYEEDFPWRYTPAKADEGAHRLRPWITLVVLEEGEFEDGRNLKDKLLPYIDVDSANDKFPPADQLWAWAHVHVNADMAAAEDQITSTNMSAVLPKLDNALKGNADVAYSRLLCPRKLKPNTAYHAFLIPTFETGRRAGLGLDVVSDFATQSAWGERPDQNQFPYYHRWFFRTGILGDFESLVRRLKAKTADQRVGRRDMDLQEPGWNLPGLDPDGTLGGILRLGGALRVPEIVIEDMEDYLKYENWADDGYPQPIQQAIANFLNLADDYQKPGASPQPIPDPDNPPDPDPLITPPLYGRWHAAVDRLLTAADGTSLPNNRNWIHELNLDPRFRVPAGFGTRVIQKHQEEYMNVAWQQVGDVVAVNRLIRFVQLTNEALLQWHTLQLQPLLASQPDKLMWLTAPVQKRILIQSPVAAPAAGAALSASASAAPAPRVTKVTVAHQLKTSLVPPVAVSAQMRRILRPRGRVVKQLPFAARDLRAARSRAPAQRGRSAACARQARAGGAVLRSHAGGRGPAAAAAALAGQTTRAFPVAAACDADPRVARAGVVADPGIVRGAARALGCWARRRRGARLRISRDAPRAARARCPAGIQGRRADSRDGGERAEEPGLPADYLQRGVPADSGRDRQPRGCALQAGRERDVRGRTWPHARPPSCRRGRR